MGPPDTHLYRMRLEARWQEEAYRRPPPPEPEAPKTGPSRPGRSLDGLAVLFGRWVRRPTFTPSR